MKKFFIMLVKIFGLLTGLLVLLFILFYMLTIGDYEVAETVEQDPSIPHIKIGNTVFHAETFGIDSHDAVMALHGDPGNDYWYILPLKGLADEYFVVFYDLRGRRNACRASPEGSIFPRIFLPGERAFHAHS